MKILLIAMIATAVLVGGLALMLPCSGCRLRRERMRQVYERWRAEHGK